MVIGSLKDLYFDELGDLYDAETQIIRFLPRLVESVHAPELRQALTKHCDESRLHLERLQLIFTHWGERPGSSACAGLGGIVQEADDRLNRATTADARDAAIIGVAQRIEHYELAAYGCARSYARRLNRPDEARLLQETLDEEGRADRRLTQIAEAHVNDDARSETDLRKQPQRHALRYVSMSQLDHSRLSMEVLGVQNDHDEDLGTFDGLILDASSRPRYIVVDARGVFTGRRYLLPVGQVRFDEGRRVLRVTLDKDVAKRYPEFDRDDFEAMTDERLYGYECRLLEFFPRDAGSLDGSQPQVDVEPPDWLMTGVWVTVPPERVHRLSEEARSFANEFTPTSSGDDDGALTSEGRTDRELVVARGTEHLAAPAESDSPTPPHGDKLR